MNFFKFNKKEETNTETNQEKYGFDIGSEVTIQRSDGAVDPEKWTVEFIFEDEGRVEVKKGILVKRPTIDALQSWQNLEGIAAIIEVGSEVVAKRSTGSVEAGWKIEELDEENNVVVIVNMVGDQALRKKVKLDDLKAWQEEEVENLDHLTPEQ